MAVVVDPIDRVVGEEIRDAAHGRWRASIAKNDLFSLQASALLEIATRLVGLSSSPSHPCLFFNYRANRNGCVFFLHLLDLQVSTL